eukprot:m.154319 g.154319  ORF g.154319 m.154319 type:complete len:56 (-) comp14376_c0_seq1:854-1021(-)
MSEPAIATGPTCHWQNGSTHLGVQSVPTVSARNLLLSDGQVEAAAYDVRRTMLDE